MEKDDLRSLIRSLFDIGVKAADPGLAVKLALEKKPLPELGDGHHYIIAIGKAACSMAQAALDCIAIDTPISAIAVTNYENQQEVRICRVIGAGHPIPDKNGLLAGRYVQQLLSAAGSNDHVLCLISGGGSALLPAPVPGLTLDDKIKVNQLMLSHGLDITQTNLVRQQLSQLKGGGMARMARPARVRTLAVSDVIGDDPRVIASGPTASRIGTANEAIEVLKKFDVWPELPKSVQSVLTSAEEYAAPVDQGDDIAVICSNGQSLSAIVGAAPDWAPKIVSSSLSGNVDAAAQQIVDFIRKNLTGTNQLLVWGGETTVKVMGTGLGGRNQELALRFAMEAVDLPGDWVFLSAGTDGRDGPTDAAGAIVDSGTVGRIRDAGFDPQDFLNDNDSYHALKIATDLLITGATGTNVADLAIFLRR